MRLFDQIINERMELLDNAMRQTIVEDAAQQQKQQQMQQQQAQQAQAQQQQAQQQQKKQAGAK